MAETPENNEETSETTDAPETVVEEVQTAASDEGAGDATATAGDEAPAAEAAPAAAPGPSGGPTRRDRLEQRRAARAEARKAKAEQRRRYRARLKTKAGERRAASPAAEPQPTHEHGPGRPKVRQGIVVSDGADKTIVVRLDLVRRHRRYRKIVRS